MICPQDRKANSPKNSVAEDVRPFAFSAPLILGVSLHEEPISLNSLDIYNFAMDNPGMHFRGICDGWSLAVKSTS